MKKAKKKPAGININITVDQFNAAIRRQVMPGIQDLKTDTDLRQLAKDWGVDPDELAKEMENELPKD